MTAGPPRRGGSRRSRRAGRSSPTASWGYETNTHREVGAVAPHREAEAMLRRRPVLHELPRSRVVVERRLEADRRRTRRIELERKFPERKRQSKAARLDVSLLQGPIIEKDALLILGWQPAQIGDFGGRKESSGDVVGELAADVFDVDANLARDRHRAGNKAIGVRDIETQVRGPLWTLADLGPAVHVLDEAPIGRSHVRVARQHRPHERAGDDERAPIAIQHEPRHPLALVCREERFVRVELDERRRIGGLHEIDMHRGKGEGVHRYFLRRIQMNTPPATTASAARPMPICAPYSFMKSAARSPYNTAR